MEPELINVFKMLNEYLIQRATQYLTFCISNGHTVHLLHLLSYLEHTSIKEHTSKIGVKNFTHFLHTLNKLSLHQVLQAANERATQVGRKENPSICVGASLLFYR
jgi:hypothetical protein